MSDPERASVATPRRRGISGPPVRPRRGRERTLTGWGRMAASRAEVIAVQDAEELPTLLAGAGCEGVIARGAGRSYGDAAQNAGGTVLDLTPLNRIVSIDDQALLARVQPGVTYETLLTTLAARGLMFAVVPGTRHVTLGGAIASDIHGKSHHVDGTIARHVASLRICTPAGGLREITPHGDPELFHAVLGGMGLLGVVAEATLRVERLAAPWWSIDSDRTDSLEQTIELMAGDDAHRYSVTWLDLMARGAAIGRAIVMASNDWGSAPITAPASRRGRPPADPASLPTSRLNAPRGFPGAVLSPPVVTAFNSLRWHLSNRRERGLQVPLATHYFQLDQVRNWNRLYGSHGFLQYQFAVPDAGVDAIVRCVELLRARRIPAYLGVLKRLGPAADGPLSFPIEGWTLALDLPGGATGLRQALDELDELVVEHGGRVYLTKDVRLRRDLLEAMYPDLDRFREQRMLADPDGILRSDLGRRLGLSPVSG
jgi:decaprenylphospho-beta-D-ribofuranose 2-oxidase